MMKEGILYDPSRGESGSNKKPTIEELEAMMDSSENMKIEVLPNGEIRARDISSDPDIVTTHSRPKRGAIVGEMNEPIARRTISYDADKITADDAFSEIIRDFDIHGVRRIIYERQPESHLYGTGKRQHQFVVEMRLRQESEESEKPS